MSNYYLGQIMMFGGNFAPKGFALCNGQLLSIQQNQALFSLLGVTYGGNGIQTFALPNLQSCLPVHQGHGPGLSNYVLGQVGGSSSVTLLQTNLPAHVHTLNATQTVATSNVIANNLLPGQPPATSPPNPPAEFYAQPVNGQPALVPELMISTACGPAGGNQPHTNLMPSLCISFIIALQGLFPSRN